jgi:hypothetical protein
MVMPTTAERAAPASAVLEGAVAVPHLVVFAAGVWLLVGWAIGLDPFWPTGTLTLSEAAAVRDHAEVVRLIEAGHDPNRRWPVRAGLLDGAAQMISPLEAAVRIRRLSLVELLMRSGAAPDMQERSALVEVALAAGAPDVAAFLRNPPAQVE